MTNKFTDMVLEEVWEWEKEHGSENAYKWGDRWYTKDEVDMIRLKRK